MARELRSDITGLRAFAVISVTLYHLFKVLDPKGELFSGGFLGVDVFFVISGYLMTMIIMRGLGKGNFSLYDFYKRRAKRICPALFFTVLLFLGLAFIFLSPNEVMRMSREAFYALLFISNVYFTNNVDYFNNHALDQPFLHTWSLSVEWQFYLLYPWLLILLTRIKPLSSTKALARTILVLTVLCFVVACVYTEVSPRAAYYMLPSRAFELLMGAVAYFYPWSKIQAYLQNRTAGSGSSGSAGSSGSSSSAGTASSDSLAESLWQRIKPVHLEALGLVILVVSLFVVNDHSGWPTASAFLPMVGAYICIAAGNKQSLLGNVVFQKLGLWSYAIYLVHWPTLIFTTKLGIEQELQFIGLSVVIVILGVLLHYAIERRRNYGYVMLALYFIGGCGGSYHLWSTGARYRLDHDVTRYAQYGGHGVPFDGEINAIGDLNRKPDFILMGDSFARHYALDLIDRGLHVVTVFTDGCYSFGNHVNLDADGNIKAKCEPRYQAQLDAIKQYPDLPVVLAQDWPRYSKSLIDKTTGEKVDVSDYEQVLTEDLKGFIADSGALQGREVYILGTPRQSVYDLGTACTYLHLLDSAPSLALANNFTCKLSAPLHDIELNALLEKVVVDNSAKYLDPNAAICTDGVCELITGRYIPVFQDGLHYSWGGSIKVNSYILSRIGVAQGKVRTDFEDEIFSNDKGERHRLYAPDAKPRTLATEATAQ